MAEALAISAHQQFVQSQYFLGEDFSAALTDFFTKANTAHSALWLVDANLPPAFIQKWQDIFAQHGCTTKHTLRLAGGDEAKTAAQLMRCLEEFLAHQPERNTVFVAVGGGAIGDLGGLCASLLLRGLPLVQIPTTILAMVDSAIGGKTAINSQYGKNLIGCFYPPRLTLADLSALQSLPLREWRCGFAEIVKAALLTGGELWQLVQAHAHSWPHSSALQTILLLAAKAKIDIVQRDPTEQGERITLNLGHSIAHALETLSHYDGRLLHGEAVALGLLVETAYAVKLGLCPPALLETIKNILQAAHLPTQIPRELAVPEKIIGIMGNDKKNSHGQIRLVLLRDIAQTEIISNPNPNLLADSINDFASADKV